MDKLNVLFAAPECYPFAKSGGLGDVVGALPKAFPKDEVDIRVILPKYACIPEKYSKEFKLLDIFYVTIGHTDQYVGIQKYRMDGVTYYFLDNEYYFKRPELYGYYDDGERFIYFCRAVLEAIPYIDFYPDILHCNDWQTALIPYLLKEQYQCHYLNTRSIFTIHNMKYQGLYGFDDLQHLLNFDYVPAAMEYYEKINLMKGALYTSDLVTTVSPSYAEEIKEPFYGEGLDGVIRDIDDKKVGILHGIDEKEYNPQIDPAIYVNYSRSLKNKTENKLALQEELDLPVTADKPMVAMITRLVEQKGLDLVAAVIHEILQMDIQLVILGTGDTAYENLLREVAYTYPDKMRTIIDFNEGLSRKIYAGSDLFLMPSKFEPCGLSQIIAMRYGSIPVVRKTGGLKDTVQYFNGDTGEGNGYVFATYNAHDMLYTIQAAVGLYYDYPKLWKTLVHNAAKTNFDWSQSAQTNLYYYKKVAGKLI
ncbi:glycogen synthase GlgA [Eubacterium aggregans]|uniref:glycogen synthase GlgA n=2 Tax=Eubacterium aggregans TaxID=81409 RepID=UPI003F30DD21